MSYILYICIYKIYIYICITFASMHWFFRYIKTKYHQMGSLDNTSKSELNVCFKVWKRLVTLPMG